MITGGTNLRKRTVYNKNEYPHAPSMPSILLSEGKAAKAKVMLSICHDHASPAKAPLRNNRQGRHRGSAVVSLFTAYPLKGSKQIKPCAIFAMRHACRCPLPYAKGRSNSMIRHIAPM